MSSAYLIALQLAVLICFASTLARDPECEDCKELNKRAAISLEACQSHCKRIWPQRACDYICRVLRRASENPGAENPCKKLNYCKHEEDVRSGPFYYGTKRVDVDIGALAAKLDRIVDNLDLITAKISAIERKISSRINNDYYSKPAYSKDEEYENLRKRYDKEQAEQEAAESIQRDIDDITRATKLLEKLEQEQQEMQEKQEKLSRFNQEYKKNMRAQNRRAAAEQIDCNNSYFIMAAIAFMWAGLCYLSDKIIDQITMQPYFLTHMNIAFIIVRGVSVVKPLVVVIVAFRIITNVGGLITIFSPGGQVAVVAHQEFKKAACWYSLALLVGLEVATMAKAFYENFRRLYQRGLSQHTRTLKTVQLIPSVIFVVSVFSLRPSFHHNLILMILYMELPRLAESIWLLLNLSEKLGWRSDAVRGILQTISGLFIMSVFNLIKYDIGIHAATPVLFGIARIVVQAFEVGGLAKYFTSLTSRPGSVITPRKRQ